jgi:regulator of nonsense transcripts 2
LDDLTGVNVDNTALLLEGCGRFLLRSDDTQERFGKMVCMSSTLVHHAANS